jgi:hypothetical protein
MEDPRAVMGAIDAWLSGPASWLLMGRRSLAGEARALGSSGSVRRRARRTGARRRVSATGQPAEIDQPGA